MSTLQNFKLLREDAATYSIAHPNGKKLTISKKGLSDKAHKLIKGLRKQQFADGGVVDLSNQDKAATAKFIDTNQDQQRLQQKYKDLQQADNVINRLTGQGTFQDTGRQSSGYGEALDSIIGAPARVGINELQNGNFTPDVADKVLSQVGKDPRNAPTGYDIASKATDNPYLGTALATSVDFGAQLPVGELAAAGKLPGIVGEIKGVKNAGKIADATEAFAERAKAPVSTETKIAQMHGTTGDVRDAVPQLIENAKAEQNLSNRKHLATEEPRAQDKDVFWHDVNDHTFTDEAKKSLDALNARGVPEESLYKIHEETTPDSPYAKSDYSALPVLPNFSATPQGVIGRPGIAEPFNGNNVEAFPWMDSKFGSAKQLLQRHSSIGMPAEIHTSSDLIGRDDYIKEIPEGSRVNIYKMTPDDSLNRILFPGNPSNKRLDAAAERLKDAGITTKVINPTGKDVWNALPEGRQQLAKQQFGSRNEFINHIDKMPGIRGVVKGPDNKKYAHGGKVKMNLDNFQLLKEDDNSYSVAHPSGKMMSISKAGLTPAAHQAIQRLARGGQVHNYAYGTPDQPVQGSPEANAELEKQNQGPVADNRPSPGEALSKIADTIFPPAPAKPRRGIEAAEHYREAARLAEKAGDSAGAPVVDTTNLSDDQIADQPALEPGQQQVDRRTPAASAPSEDNEPMTQRNVNLNQGMEEEQRANTAGAQAVQGQGEQEVNAINANQALIDKMPTQMDIVNANRQKNDNLMQAYMDKKIDPQHYMHSMDTSSKIAAGIGLFLGGMSQGYIGGSNPAMDVIQTAIGRDIDAQKNDQSKAHTLWSMNKDALGTDLAANLATQNQMYTGLKYKLQLAASQFKGPIAMANAQAANAQIDQKIAQNNFRMSFLQPNKEASTDPNYPAKVVANSGLFSAEDQKMAMEEIKNATNITNNGPKMMEAFDNAANTYNTVDLIPGMENKYQKALHQLMLPNFKTIDGTVRQAAMDESFKNLTPQAFDSPSTKASKRKNFIDWMESESAAPVNAGHGNDLKKYPSTRGMPTTAPVQPSAEQQKIQIFMKQNPQVKDPNQAKDILKKAGKL